MSMPFQPRLARVSNTAEVAKIGILTLNLRTKFDLTYLTPKIISKPVDLRTRPMSAL